jgi:hypothetical protein
LAKLYLPTLDVEENNFGMDGVAFFHPQMVFDFPFANLQYSLHSSKKHFSIEVPNCTQIENANFYNMKIQSLLIKKI